MTGDPVGQIQNTHHHGNRACESVRRGALATGVVPMTCNFMPGNVLLLQHRQLLMKVVQCSRMLQHRDLLSRA